MMDYLVIDDKTIGTIVAVTEQDHIRGLMFRYEPSVMIFPYKKAEIRKFWMKNCPLALDIIFCYKNNIIGICKGEPWSEDHIGPDTSSDLVIEMPYDSSKKLSIKIGSHVEVKYSLTTVAQIYSYKFKNENKEIYK
jgi:uncharacterized membrane protein (UPF0127 family)